MSSCRYIRILFSCVK